MSIKSNYNMGFWFIVFLITVLNASCVSVKLNEELKPAEPSKIKYTEPKEPFKQTELFQADKAWQSNTTGNSISYITDCKPNSQPLKLIRTNFFSGIDEFQVTEESTLSFNNREALQSIITGKMEGVGVKIKILIFKKNFCTYSLSYISLKTQYDQELPYFNSFIEGFKVYD